MNEAESIIVKQGNICPSCNIELPLSYNFCHLCGLPLPAYCCDTVDNGAGRTFTDAEIQEVEKQAEIEALTDYLANDPVASYRGHVGKSIKTLTGLLRAGEMPETLTTNQATMTNQGKRPSSVNIINGKVPVAYCLDQVRDHFGDRFDSTSDLIDEIETVGKAKKRLAELRGY